MGEASLLWIWVPRGEVHVGQADLDFLADAGVVGPGQGVVVVAVVIGGVGAVPVRGEIGEATVAPG